MKICTKCGDNLPLTSFYKSTRDGYIARCKSCQLKAKRQWEINNFQRVLSYQKDWRKNNHEYYLNREKIRYVKNRNKLQLKALLFGRAKKLEIRNKLLDIQHNKCAICQNTFEESLRINVDHSYKTNLIRGLLCTSCNLGVGWIEKYEDFAEKAREYILNHPAKDLAIPYWNHRTKRKANSNKLKI